MFLDRLLASIRTNALDHGAEPVRALRGQMLAQAKPLENRDSIHRKNIAGPLAGENCEQNGDEPAHDVGIAVAGEGEHGSARTIRMHGGCEPNLAGAALDLVRLGTVTLRQRVQAAAEFDDIACNGRPTPRGKLSRISSSV